MKLKSYKILAPEKDFLAIPDHYVNITAKIAYANLTGLKVAMTDVYGNTNVIPRGTLVNVDGDGVVNKPTASLLPNAVIFDTINIDDYDSTDTYVNATVLVHGFVRADRLKELTSGDTAKLDNKQIYVFNK